MDMNSLCLKDYITYTKQPPAIHNLRHDQIPVSSSIPDKARTVSQGVSADKDYIFLCLGTIRCT